jgi:hypothetical protein
VDVSKFADAEDVFEQVGSDVGNSSIGSFISDFGDLHWDAFQKNVDALANNTTFSSGTAAYDAALAKAKEYFDKLQKDHEVTVDFTGTNGDKWDELLGTGSF